MKILEIEIDEFIIKENRILHKIKFDLNSSEMIVVLGKNGAGKSTFLKHLSGEIDNEKSKILIRSKRLQEYELNELAKKRAILRQQTSINFAFDVLDVVLFGRIPFSRAESSVQNNIEIAMRALDSVGLKGYETRNYLSLSGGEQQRVNLARTVVQLDEKYEDKILLLDEPTSSLDIAHQYLLMNQLKALTAKGLGVVAILHDINLASRFADKIALLKDGAIYSYGNPESVINAQNIAEIFSHQVTVIPHPIMKYPIIISNL